MQSNKTSGKAKLPNVKKIINFPPNKMYEKSSGVMLCRRKKNTLKTKLEQPKNVGRHNLLTPEELRQVTVKHRKVQVPFFSLTISF